MGTTGGQPIPDPAPSRIRQPPSDTTSSIWWEKTGLDAGLLEGPGCPQPEQRDGRRGRGDTTGVAACQKANGEVAKPVQSEGEQVFW